MKNKAKSAWNRTTANTVVVYVNSGYWGDNDVFYPGYAADLFGAYLDNASHQFTHIG